MIRNPQQLIRVLQDYARSQLAIFNKQGLVIHLDGTLMSIVNILLTQQFNIPTTIVVCKFSENETLIKRLTSIIRDFNLTACFIKDLQNEFSSLNPFDQPEFKLQTALKKRLSDLIVDIECDTKNHLALSNLSYSQWCINFPHSNYKNLNNIHLLNSLLYSEIQELARYMGVPNYYIEAAPSHFLFANQLDSDSLGFSYEELEFFLNQKEIASTKDQAIQAKLSVEDRHKYLSPTISRSSNILS